MASYPTSGGVSVGDATRYARKDAERKRKKRRKKRRIPRPGEPGFSPYPGSTSPDRPF